MYLPGRTFECCGPSAFKAELHGNHRHPSTSLASSVRQPLTTRRVLRIGSPHPSAHSTQALIPTSNMAEAEVQNLNRQLHQTLGSKSLAPAASLLSKAKIALLQLNALIPTPQTPSSHLKLARETLELGALISIREKDPPAFTRYFQQLAPFYALPQSVLSKDGGNESKITGLYLLLLLSMGDYAGFHTSLEGLEATAEEEGRRLEEDAFVQYPIRVERALMEGSYDRVWGETKNSQLPSEEFAVFSEVSYSLGAQTACGSHHLNCGN